MRLQGQGRRDYGLCLVPKDDPARQSCRDHRGHGRGLLCHKLHADLSARSSLVRDTDDEGRATTNRDPDVGLRADQDLHVKV